jgi:hypothetical protein
LANGSLIVFSGHPGKSETSSPLTQFFSHSLLRWLQGLPITQKIGRFLPKGWPRLLEYSELFVPGVFSSFQLLNKKVKQLLKTGGNY